MGKWNPGFWAGLGLGVAAGYVATQQVWVLGQICKNVPHSLDQHRNKAPKGLSFSETSETATYTRRHTIEDGIERVVYTPQERRFETPIVMQHGMWHGAWCWRLWQELFAEWGWETHAHSLPGHAGSAMQRPLARCTLDYYLGFLKDECDRLPRRPVLMGHSMGGALTQWYLKYAADDLAAAVLVAAWVSHSMFKDGGLALMTYDPIGFFSMFLTWDASPLKRMARNSAVHFLVGPDAAVPIAELQPQLDSESTVIFYQHNPPFWSPPKQVNTPMLWLAGEDDPLLCEPAERRSANYYGADFVVAERARHNLMMEHNYEQTARTIHDWLVEQGVK